MTDKNKYVAQRAMTFTDGKSVKVGDTIDLTPAEAAGLGQRVISLDDHEKLTALKAKTNPMYQPIETSNTVVATHDSGEKTLHKDSMEHGPYENPPKEGGQLREFDEHGRLKRPRVTQLPQGDIPTAPTVAAIENAQEGAAKVKKAEPLAVDENIDKDGLEGHRVTSTEPPGNAQRVVVVDDKGKPKK